MRRLLMLVWLLASMPTVPGGLLELKLMIQEVTGKSALKSYGFYGCYCGLGGQGTPVDRTDWCCWEHDQCYGHLQEEGCSIRTQSYRYRVQQGKVTCGRGTSCQTRLCACDQKLVYCLKRNLWSYNPRYQYHYKFLCR